MQKKGAQQAKTNDADTDVRNELSERDRKILDFEQQWWNYSTSKDAGVQELFDLTTTQYYQRLNFLIDTEGALAYAPLLVKRLRRLRQQRTQTRGQRVLGI